jgi:hypothetical protein
MARKKKKKKKAKKAKRVVIKILDDAVDEDVGIRPTPEPVSVQKRKAKSIALKMKDWFTTNDVVERMNDEMVADPRPASVSLWLNQMAADGKLEREPINRRRAIIHRYRVAPKQNAEDGRWGLI